MLIVNSWKPKKTPNCFSFRQLNSKQCLEAKRKKENPIFCCKIYKKSYFEDEKYPILSKKNSPILSKIPFSYISDFGRSHPCSLLLVWFGYLIIRQNLSGNLKLCTQVRYLYIGVVRYHFMDETLVYVRATAKLGGEVQYSKDNVM